MFDDNRMFEWYLQYFQPMSKTKQSVNRGHFKPKVFKFIQ